MIIPIIRFIYSTICWRKICNLMGTWSAGPAHPSIDGSGSERSENTPGRFAHGVAQTEREGERVEPT